MNAFDPGDLKRATINKFAFLCIIDKVNDDHRKITLCCTVVLSISYATTTVKISMAITDSTILNKPS